MGALGALLLSACGTAAPAAAPPSPSPSPTPDLAQLAADLSALGQSVPRAVADCDPDGEGFSPETCSAAASAAGDDLGFAADHADTAAREGSLGALTLRETLDRCAADATSLAAASGGTRELDQELGSCWDQAAAAYRDLGVT